MGNSGDIIPLLSVLDGKVKERIMRKPLIVGNWKMNMDRQGAVELARGLVESKVGGDVEVGVCPPFVYLIPVYEVIKDSQIKLGAQDVYVEPKGAFTGEISPVMLKDVGCEYVIIGHSERRHIIGEGDELINKKLRSAIENGLKPILCVGEKLEERDAGNTERVVETQLAGGLDGLSAEQLKDLVIAYEPVWAIGTGRNATPEQAEEVHIFVREWVKNRFGQEFAENIRIQYGGSVKPSNAYELISQPDIDGALVGGASLKVDDFVGIIEAGIKAKL